MKKGFIFLILCGLLMALPLFAEDARVYNFEKLIIDAEIQPDGSMLVREERTVNFREGQFNGLYQWIKTKNELSIGELLIEDIQVEEKGQPYVFNPGSTYGPPGTYFIKKEPGQVYIDWSFKAARERRTFVLKYKVLNAVGVFPDVAELYYQFVGAEWEKPVEQVIVNLTLPAGAQPGEVRAWGHGPLHGNVQIKNSQKISWEIQPLPEKTFLEGRVTFPSQLIPAGKKIS
jgi:uncharacterized membrane protein